MDSRLVPHNRDKYIEGSILVDELKQDLTKKNITCTTEAIQKALIYNNGRQDEGVSQNYNSVPERVTYPPIVDTLFHNPFFVPKAKKGKKKKKK